MDLTWVGVVLNQLLCDILVLGHDSAGLELLFLVSQDPHVGHNLEDA